MSIEKKQRSIVQDDLDENPILAALGAEIGDKVAVSLSDDAQAAKDAADQETQ